MKEKDQAGQGLTSTCHYVIPVPLHDTSPAPGRRWTRARKRPLSIPSLTFAQLKSCMTERAHAGHGISPASLPNALSALNQFMAQQGCSDEQPIGTVLRASYFKAVSTHVRALQEAGRPSEYVRNRKTLLKRWRKLLLELDRAAAAGQQSETPFQHALHQLFQSSASIKAVASSTAISYGTLKRWLGGSLPRPGSIAHVRVLERHFGQSAGALADLLPWKSPPKPSAATPELSGSPIAYRERLAIQVQQEYALKDAGEALRDEWSHFLHHKTSLSAGGLLRARHGKWALTDQPAKRESELGWFATVRVLGGKPLYCATAAIQWGELSRYLGWLSLTKDQGGAGRLGCDAQSMPCLLDCVQIERYVEWRIARSGGALHQGVGSFLKTVRSLCHPKTGFLTQSRERFPGHPEAAHDERWRHCCQRAFEQAQKLLEQVDDAAQCSRDSQQPVAYILSLPNPLAAVADAITRMNAARPSTGGAAEAIWMRNRLMVKLFASNPLRAKNMKLLTIAPGANGEPPQLRKVNGVWRIAIDRKDFKNMAGAAKDRTYDMPVRKEVWPDLETYLRDYRPLLTDSSNPYLFVSKKRSVKPMHYLNRCFESITRRYFPRCPGVGPHAMRHLVATTILKLHPNAWSAAAFALHDREETVRKHYAHLSSDDAARWVETLMGDALAGM